MNEPLSDGRSTMVSMVYVNLFINDLDIELSGIKRNIDELYKNYYGKKRVIYFQFRRLRRAYYCLSEFCGQMTIKERIKIAKTSFSGDKWIELKVDTFKNQCQQKKIKVHLRSQELKFIYTDLDAMSHILDAIFLNVLDAATSGSWINVSVSKLGIKLIIVVESTYRFEEENVIDWLKNPEAHQGEPNRSFGLNYYLANTYAEALGGSCMMSFSKGGLMFQVSLPVTQESEIGKDPAAK